MAAKKRPASKKAAKQVARASRTSRPVRPARAVGARASKGAGRDLVSELLDDLPPLPIVEREAFRALFDDAQCVELGGKTKAEKVLAEAAAWASTIDAALKSHPNALRRYSTSRFAFFLEQVRDLGRAIEAQKRAPRGEADAGGALWLLDIGRVAALSVREELLAVLRLLAGGNAHERELLELAAGATTNDEALADSLEGLATHAHKWLERRDAQTAVLVASVSLKESDVDSARSAEMALREALKAQQSGPVSTRVPRDLPKTDRVEGRVLLELRVLMDVFANARAKNRAVPKLVPGPGTRAVLGAAR
jgi:hypothetical protein